MTEPIDLAPRTRVQILTERVRRLAEGQEGVVSRTQLTNCGLSGGDISRWISQGRIIRILPGVYALGHTRITWRGRVFAALLYGGPGSALSYDTAAYLWGCLESPDDQVHVSSATGRQSVGFVRMHRRRKLETVELGSFRVTSPAQTLIDISFGRSDHQLRKMLARADYRGLLNTKELRTSLGRGKRGSAALGAAIERHMPELAKTLSPLEDKFLFLCEKHGLPLPEPNVWIEGFLVDALWRNEKVIVELDGRANHSSPSQRRRDDDRDDQLRAAGFVVLRYTWSHVTRKPSRVASEIRAALARNRAN
jgi:hypothetical protein